MAFIHKFSGFTLLLLSAYMMLSGLITFVGTSGVVRGSEFSLLITISNQLSLFTGWLGLYAVWLVSEKLSTKRSS